MATVLALSGFCNLVNVNDGEIALTFNSMRYGRDDVVPIALLTVEDCPEPPCTAGDYVAHCMSRQFGTDQGGWPPLARDFVSEEAPLLSPIH